ncbi:hypothetical protein KL904_001241 [Ogataea polymorpha]|nr:hypothetical protein KL904_001241 [Ogataea polymorpha]
MPVVRVLGPMLASIALSWASASLALALVVLAYSRSEPLILITALEYAAGLLQIACLWNSNHYLNGTCVLVNLLSIPVVIYWLETVLDAPSKCKHIELAMLTTYILSCLFKLTPGRRLAKLPDPEANVRNKHSAQTLVDEMAEKALDFHCQKSLDPLVPEELHDQHSQRDSEKSDKCTDHNISSESFNFQYKADIHLQQHLDSEVPQMLPQLEETLAPVSCSSAELENITEIPKPHWVSPADPGLNHISLEAWNQHSRQWHEEQQLWGNNFFKRPDLTRSFSDPSSVLTEYHSQGTQSRSRSSTITRHSRVSPSRSIRKAPSLHSTSSSPLKRLRSLKFKKPIGHSQSQPELNFEFLKSLQTSPIRTHQHQKTLSSNFKTPSNSPVKSVAGVSLRLLNETHTPESQQSNRSNESSVPSVVVGAYDREKWHAIKNQLMHEAQATTVPSVEERSPLWSSA